MKATRLSPCIAVLCILLPAVVQTAGGQQLPSVDIDTAMAQIKQFQEENIETQTRMEILSSSNEQIAEDIELWASWRRAVANVSELLESRASELQDILAELASKTVMLRAQSAFDTYSRISALLAAKEQDLTSRIAEGEQTIRRNESAIETYRTRIQRNNANIELLQSAIQKSLNSEDRIKNYLDAFEEAIKKAQEVLESPNADDSSAPDGSEE